nr:hypothetical protein [Caballeronia catudaia]
MQLVASRRVVPARAERADVERRFAKIARKLAAADHEHPIARAVNGLQPAPVENHALHFMRSLDLNGGEVKLVPGSRRSDGRLII